MNSLVVDTGYWVEVAIRFGLVRGQMTNLLNAYYKQKVSFIGLHSWADESVVLAWVDRLVADLSSLGGEEILLGIDNHGL